MRSKFKKLLVVLFLTTFTINSAYSGVESVVMKYKDIAPAECKHCQNKYLTEIDLFSGEKFEVNTNVSEERQKKSYPIGNVIIRRFCSCYLNQEKSIVDKEHKIKLKFPDYQKYRKSFKKYNDEQFKLLINYNKAQAFIYLYKRMLYKDLATNLQKDNHIGALPLVILGPFNATEERVKFVNDFEKRYLKELASSVKSCASRKLFKCTLDEFIKKFMATTAIPYMNACINSRRFISVVGNKRTDGRAKWIRRLEKSSNPVGLAGLQEELGVVKDFIKNSKYLHKMSKEVSKENSDIYEKSEKFETKLIKNSYVLFSNYLQSRKFMIKELTTKRVILTQHGVEFEVSFDEEGKVKDVLVSENRSIFKIYGIGNRDIKWKVSSQYKPIMNNLSKDLRKALFNKKCPTKKPIELTIIELEKRKIKAEEENKAKDKNQKDNS